MRRFGLTVILVLLGLAASALAGEAQPGAPSANSGIKPITSLWGVSLQRFPLVPESDAALARNLKDWRAMGVFDAFLLIDLPPTFVDEKEFGRKANALMKEVGGPFIIATLPVGKEGWETSANQRMAQKQKGTHYDASKAMSQVQWLETMKDLQADIWGWVLEQPAHMPTPAQAAGAATEFVKFAKAQHKQAVIWLSAQALTHGPAVEAMTRAICEATRADADYFAWMDLEEESLRAGESRWQETMGEVLDQILALTPKEKTVIQWLNNPRWPAKDVAGTKAYIQVCQSKGINRFHVLFPPQGILDREPWREFYRSLPKQKLKDQGILNDEQLAKYQRMGPQMGGARGAGAGANPGGRPGVRTSEFPRGSGHRWMVNGGGRADQRRQPGNNYWSDAPDMVWVDDQGLHLKIVKRDGQWRCSALGLPEGLGYGKYVFSLASRVDHLDRNVVLRLFTYNNETFKTDANGELDVEISSWGKATPAYPQICYTVQPSMGRAPERGHQTPTTPDEKTTHVIEWTPRYVDFRSYEGIGETGKQIGHFRFDDTNPGRRARNRATGEESEPVVIPNPRNKSHASINLWLVRGEPPANPETTEVEVIVSDFHFVPAPPAGP